MSRWLKQDAPGPGPKPPARTDLMSFYRFVDQTMQQSGGQLPPDVAYLLKVAPVAAEDRWGMPLPLSENEQNRLDRLAAVMASPLVRGRLLLISGQLGPDEVEALVAGRPEAYAVLVHEATREVLEAGPPIAAWAEAQLAILFGRPAGQVFTGEKAPAEQQAAGNGGRPGGAVVPFGTPADRREVAVREGGSQQ